MRADIKKDVLTSANTPYKTTVPAAKMDDVFVLTIRTPVSGKYVR